MTADTAMTVALEILNGTKFEDLKFEDRPTFKLNQYESIEMPFRYLVKEGEIVLADGMRELWSEQNDFDVDDF